MIATIISEKIKHYPVLLKEIISIITPQYGGTFIDCTFGQGGYSKKILEFDNTKVIALDRDIESKKIANQMKEKFDDRFLFKNLKFSQLKNLNIFSRSFLFNLLMTSFAEKLFKPIFILSSPELSKDKPFFGSFICVYE